MISFPYFLLRPSFFMLGSVRSTERKEVIMTEIINNLISLFTGTLNTVLHFPVELSSQLSSALF